MKAPSNFLILKDLRDQYATKVKKKPNLKLVTDHMEHFRKTLTTSIFKYEAESFPVYLIAQSSISILKEKTKCQDTEIKTRNFERLDVVEFFHADFHNYAYTWKRFSLEELKTLDNGTRLFDNAAFVCIHMMERFSKDFLEV